MSEKQQASTQPICSTRRGFLKNTAAGVSAAGASAAGVSASVAANLAISRTAHAAGNETIKIGMIGCGGRCSGAAAQALSLGPYVKLEGMDLAMVVKKMFEEDILTIPPDFIETEKPCTSSWWGEMPEYDD